MFGPDTGFASMPRPGGLLDWFWRVRVALGGLLIAAGVLVAVFPQILVWIVAASIISVGMGLVGSGLRSRARLRGSSGPGGAHSTTHTRTRVEIYPPR